MEKGLKPKVLDGEIELKIEGVKGGIGSEKEGGK